MGIAERETEVDNAAFTNMGARTNPAAGPGAPVSGDH
jgi:hypothetical protein